MKREGEYVELTAAEIKKYVENGGGTANAYLNIQKENGAFTGATGRFPIDVADGLEFFYEREWVCCI